MECCARGASPPPAPPERMQLTASSTTWFRFCLVAAFKSATVGVCYMLVQIAKAAAVVAVGVYPGGFLLDPAWPWVWACMWSRVVPGV